MALPTTSFVCGRINNSTFLVIEDDKFDERPYIYAKIYPNRILITDTGCNTPRRKDRSLTSLRKYLETFPIPANGDQPLNPGGNKNYVIICSHCHYDHILGIPEFSSADPTIIASGFDKRFLLNDLPAHSLCKYLQVPTPEYTISHWASHAEYYSSKGTPLRIQLLYVPGHTPDSLAWYDLDEHHLYVGDTFYERKCVVPVPIPDLLKAIPDPSLPTTQGAIIFPEQGNWIQYISSLHTLLSFVTFRNSQLKQQHGGDNGAPKVKVGCGHLTHSADAEEMILEVRSLFERIIAGKVPVTGTEIVRGVTCDFWLESEDARYSVKAPRQLVVDARKHFHPSSCT
jgi:glyoxylase-like metal-dependent hydrolase (beta-lactamase superfamily II)